MALFRKPPPPRPRAPGLIDHLVKAATAATADHMVKKLTNEIEARHGADSLLARVARAGGNVLDKRADQKHGEFEDKAANTSGYPGQLAAAAFRTVQGTLHEQRQAAQIPSGDQCYAMGKRELEAGNYAAAFRHYETGGNQEHLRCINGLAFCFEQGLGVATDTEQAIALYLYAAERGLVDAQSNLASILFEARRLVECAMWAQRAADASDAGGQYLTGYFHEHGLGGLPQNHEEARRWYRLSAAQNEPDAITALAALDAKTYERGTPEWAAHELSVRPNAGREEINLAWRKWMKIAHSDTGGDDDWASELNLARAILLAQLG